MKISFRSKVLLGVSLLTAVLIISAIFLSFRFHRNSMLEYYETNGISICRTVASRMDPDVLLGYVDESRSREENDRLMASDTYQEIYDFLMDVKQSSNVAYLYMYYPAQSGGFFLFDTDNEETASRLGDYLEYYEGEDRSAMLRGEELEPTESDDEDFGRLLTIYYPYKTDDGELVCYINVDLSIDEIEQEEREFVLTLAAVMIGVAAVFVVAFLLLLNRIFIKPINAVAQAATEFVATADNRERESSISQLDIHTGDEIENLAEAVQKMERDLTGYVRDIAQTAAEKERMATELSVAADIQRDMLPVPLPDFPGKSCFELASRQESGSRIGGNFYDYFLVDQSRVAVVFGDVSGSGIPAALLMVIAKAVIKSNLTSGLDISQALSAANTQLFGYGDSDLTVSAFVGILDTGSGRFDYINAGFQPPLILQSGQRYEWVTSTAFSPLGMSENVNYRALTLDLRQSDRILWYTEGLIEQENKEGTIFGAPRLRETLNAYRGRQLAIPDLIQTIFDEVEVFAEGNRSPNVMALLALEYKKGARDLSRLTLSAAESQTSRLVAFLKDCLEQNGISGREYATLAVATEELFSICCRRAQWNSPIQAEFTAREGRMFLTLAGEMNGQNPLRQGVDANIQNGIDFIGRCGCQLEYQRLGGQDCLTMIFPQSKPQNA